MAKETCRGPPASPQVERVAPGLTLDERALRTEHMSSRRVAVPNCRCEVRLRKQNCRARGVAGRTLDPASAVVAPRDVDPERAGPNAPPALVRLERGEVPDRRATFARARNAAVRKDCHRPVILAAVHSVYVVTASRHPAIKSDAAAPRERLDAVFVGDERQLARVVHCNPVRSLGKARV